MTQIVSKLLYKPISPHVEEMAINEYSGGLSAIFVRARLISASAAFVAPARVHLPASKAFEARGGYQFGHYTGHDGDSNGKSPSRMSI